MKQTAKSGIRLILSLVLTFQLLACGLILYPERQGQHSGRLDPGIVLLDAVGLFFFIIPGVIAFGVDFTTGAIYLPEGHPDRSLGERLDDIFDRNKKSPTKKLQIIQLSPEERNIQSVLNIVSEKTGHRVELGDPGLRIRAAKNTSDLSAQLTYQLARLP